MSIFAIRIKKMMALGCATFAVSFMAVSSAKAQTTTSTTPASSYLELIAQYTYGSMQELNSLPTIGLGLIMLTQTWLSGDTTKTTSTLQGDMGTAITNDITDSTLLQKIQPYLLWDLYGATPVTGAPNFTYQSLIGMSLPTANPRPKNPPPDSTAYNYLKYAAGMGIAHVPPASSWTGAASDITNYTNYFNTVTAVETYNTYILSQLYTRHQTGLFQAAQQNLVNDAGSSTWFTQVASESLGVVLRQLLMFNSQMFLLMRQILDTQKQMIAAQAMTNTTLLLIGQTNEQTLLRKAVRPMPGS